MPYELEHAARLKDPGLYDKFRRENNTFAEGINSIWGIREEDGEEKVELQSIRFNKESWTEARAIEWLRDHNYSPIKFEPAAGEEGINESSDEGPFEITGQIVSRIKESVDPEVQAKYGDHVIGSYKIMCIEEGLSINGRLYEGEMLKENKGVFDGCRVVARGYDVAQFDHLPRNVKRFLMQNGGIVKDVIGKTIDPVYESINDASGKKRTGITATFLLFESGKEYKSIIDDSCKGTGLAELSIDGDGPKEVVIREGRPIVRVKGLDRIDELTVVSHASAGGGFLSRLAASAKEKIIKEVNMYEKLVRLIRRLSPTAIREGQEIEDQSEVVGIFEGIVESLTEEVAGKELMLQLSTCLEHLQEGRNDEAVQVINKLLENVKQQFTFQESEEDGAEGSAEPAPKPSPPAEPEPSQDEEEEDEEEEDEDITESISEMKARQKKQDAVLNKLMKDGLQTTLDRELTESQLPEPVQRKLKKEFSGIFEVSDLREAIQEEKQVLAELTEGGMVSIGGQSRSVSMGNSPLDFAQKRMDLMIDPSLKESKEYQGIDAYYPLEAWIALTGDREVRGRFSPQKISGGLQEAIAPSTFSDLLGVSMNKRLVRAFDLKQFSWRDFVYINNDIRDFKEQTITRVGGFNNLDDVAAGDPYTALNDPGDEAATYTPFKKGNLVEILRETIKNDDLRWLRTVPGAVNRAAMRTLNRFVFDLLIGWDGAAINAALTTYDGLTHYNATHNNYSTDPMSYDAVQDALVRLWSQTAFDGGTQTDVDYIMQEDSLFLVFDPRENESVAASILEDEYVPGTNPAMGEKNKLKGKLKPIRTTFLRDSKDWYVAAAPVDAEGIEIGFMDGKETPELITQDDPSVGKMFTHDTLTYKIRYEFGGAFIAHQPFQGNFVT